MLDLVVGLVALHRGPEAWEWWVALQGNPVNVVLTVVALVMSTVHAVTWYAVAPKIVRIRRGRSWLAGGWIVGAQYVALALVAAVVVAWLSGRLG